MFEFNSLPNWYRPPYVVDSVEYDDLRGRYIFFLYTHDDGIAGFVRSLPQIQAVFQGLYDGPWMVTLHPLHSQDECMAERAYNTVLVSINAHLNPPLHDEAFHEFVETLEL